MINQLRLSQIVDNAMAWTRVRSGVWYQPEPHYVPGVHLFRKTCGSTPVTSNLLDATFVLS